MRKIERLQLTNGDEPFKIWIDQLDRSTRAKIYTSIDRVAAGGAKKNIKAERLCTEIMLMTKI